MALTTTYSHAAPYIRERALSTADLKLGARTQRERARLSGQLFGIIAALHILLNSPEGQDSPVGMPPFHGNPRAVDELERYLGGHDEMVRLGFVEEDAA